MVETPRRGVLQEQSDEVIAARVMAGDVRTSQPRRGLLMVKKDAPPGRLYGFHCHLRILYLINHGFAGLKYRAEIFRVRGEFL